MFRKLKVIHQAMTNVLAVAVLCILLASGTTAQTGAAREAFKGSTEFRDAVDATASSIEKYVSQLERTDRSLARLAGSNGDLAERYQSFAKDLRRLEKTQKNAVSDVERMRAHEREYFTAWDKANMQIADPELRRSLAIRRARVMAEYQTVADELSETGRELQPLMSHLRDLDLYLGGDPSRANVEEASAMIGISRDEVRFLKHDIIEVHRSLKVFLNEMLGI